MLFVAIRVGGMYAGELHYPVSSYAGHRNSFWSFSEAALAGSPVPGYSPGSGDRAEAARFTSWYLASLSNYGKWLATRYRTPRPDAGAAGASAVLATASGRGPGRSAGAVVGQ